MNELGIRRDSLIESRNDVTLFMEEFLSIDTVHQRGYDLPMNTITSELQVIGQVEILIPRIYGKDPEVVVEPGVYPLLRTTGSDDQVIFWSMVGKVNERNKIEDIPDMPGAFSFRPGDWRSDTIAAVASLMYTPAEFEEFLASDPLTNPGPAQRLRIEVF